MKWLILSTTTHFKENIYSFEKNLKPFCKYIFSQKNMRTIINLMGHT